MKKIFVLSSIFFLLLSTIAFSQEEKHEIDSLKNIVSQAEKGNPGAQNVVGTWYYTGENFPQDYDKAYKWWSFSASKGNQEAIGNLGLLYQYGRGVEADSVKALKYYVLSIESGNQLLLQQRERMAKKGEDNFNAVLCAICYMEGKGVDKDMDKSLSYWNRAAKGYSVDAYRELGYIYKRKNDLKQSARFFKKAADEGDIPSIYQYAKICLDDKFLDKDFQVGIVYLIKAAEAGNIQAQCDLGTFYYQGKYVTKDPQNAVKWFKLAAAKEWALAQWNLALCYIDGVGVVRDYDQAIYWLGKATSKQFMSQFEQKCADRWNNSPFMTYLEGMALYFSEGREIDKAYDKFKKLKKNIVEAETMMSVCLVNKNFKKCNPKKGFKLLSKVASSGNSVALFYLASLYEAGNGTNKDLLKALELYKSSADKGYAISQCYLGNLFYEGRLVERDYTKAVYYYKLAENQGQLTDVAAKRYAQCFEEGLGGLEVNEKKAKQLKDGNYKNTVVPMLRKVSI